MIASFVCERKKRKDEKEKNPPLLSLTIPVVSISLLSHMSNPVSQLVCLSNCYVCSSIGCDSQRKEAESLILRKKRSTNSS